MSRVALEVEKLIDYKVSGTLTREEVDDIVYKDADYRMYEMTNAVARRDFGKFTLIQSELCRKSGDEANVLSGLFSFFKNSLTMLCSREGDAQLAKMLRMKEYGVKKGREQAAAIGEDRLKKYVALTYSALADIKSGAVTPQSALLNVNNAIFFD